MVQLEKYHGTKSRHTCPACNSRNCFVRYIDENGEYISDDCGRCNRESKCGYEYKPKQFFADNPSLKSAKTKKRGTPNYAFVVKNGSTVEYKAKAIAVKPDYIPFEQFKLTLGNYDRNAFVQFLLNLFSDCHDEIQVVLKMYLVGTYEDGLTVFWQIGGRGKIRTGKIMRYDAQNGHRQVIRTWIDKDGEKHESKVDWIHRKIKKDFNLKQCFFGEDLLRQLPDKPIAIVEAEKTAIIASLCFPEFVWLAAGSATNLSLSKLLKFQNRKIILYPDANKAAFERWQKVAQDAARQGLNVIVSDLLETRATDQEKADGYDLADYLINQQTEINEINEFIDRYNFAVDKTQACTTLPRELKTILEETISIIEINGNLSRIEAERVATAPESMRRIIPSL